MFQIKNCLIVLMVASSTTVYDVPPWIAWSGKMILGFSFRDSSVSSLDL